ncbi:SH3 domain-containing protein [Alkalinema sp. FACHB-956]|uniref:SH3 domain-containing protein n=1 Tax=Alkalinema sp. FACHB-956 TaxID=2692768 RepID=UPI001682F677|nr:SH3 domain-containing protein [Alkalinema sp. FACHB-956]MBD2325553.1 SH3 domain-containing protein [Alkalinema sp. FACHB-956]
MKLQLPLVVGMWLTAGVTVVGVGYATLRPKPSQSFDPRNASPVQLAKLSDCQTLSADPKPLLNVRSTPSIAPDNIVGTIKNGVNLAVVDERDGWLQINAPVSGWVYRNLTVTTCDTSGKRSDRKPLELAHPASSRQLIAEAQEQWHAGNLAGALNRLRQVPAEDPAYTQVENLMGSMTVKWKQAEDAYGKAEVAIATRRPQMVLAMMHTVPDIRYWRSKMAPLVKRAIELQLTAELPR